MPYQEDAPLISRSNGDDPSTVQRHNGNSHDATLIDRPRLFAGISPADYTSICRVARVKDFARGDVLHIEGDVVARVTLLTSGCVKLTKLGRDGTEVILRLAVPGDFLSPEGVIWCGLHCATAQAFRACRVLAWDARVLHQNMLAILGEHLRELEDRFREVATERVGARVALQLLRLLKTMGRPVSAGVEVDLSREDLAQMTGTTLFTVSRLLSAWEGRGVVKNRREAVAICDVESLRAISQEEPREESPGA